MINDLIMIMISYFLIILISFGILAFLQAGFLIPFLKVKISRGKKILVQIMKDTGSDFVAAQLIEGVLVFKYFKEEKRVSKFSNGLYRSFNINCVDLVGSSWAVINKDFEVVSTNDPAKTDSLIERALMRPDKRTTKENIILLLLVILCFGLLFVAYKLAFVQTLIQQLGGVTGRSL